MDYELHKITTADGIIYELNDAHVRFVLSTPGNLGLAPIEWQTIQGYKQDGETETGYRLTPRVFSVSIHQKNECSRENFWAIRRALLDICRPNRNGPITYSILQDGGKSYSIQARTNTPIYAETSNTEWNEWGISEVLQFECFDPIWFLSDITTQAVSYVQATSLIFPITFSKSEITFGALDSFGTLVINYQGDWYAWPVFTITGPFTYIQIDHLELGVDLRLIYPALVGDTIVINLEEKTITDQNGISLLGFLTSTSDFVGIKIEPDPIVTNGINTFSFAIGGITIPNTSVSVSYKTRFIGI